MITQIEQSKVSGTNAERLAMAVTPGNFMAFYETDTNSEYEWKGSEWVQTSTNGAAHVTTQGGTTDYGPYPATYYDGSALAVTMAASASGTVVITSGDLSAYNQTLFEVVAIGGTTPALKVYPSFDGTTFAATPIGLINLNDLTVIDGDTGVVAIGIFAVGTPPGGALKVKKLKWVQTGGAADQTCQLRGGLGWV